MPKKKPEPTIESAQAAVDTARDARLATVQRLHENPDDPVAIEADNAAYAEISRAEDELRKLQTENEHNADLRRSERDGVLLAGERQEQAAVNAADV